jgi:2-haloacid dehalogenase
MRRARRRVDEGNGLADKLAAPDDPVQRVLESPWDAMRVLRAGNEHGGGGVELEPELRDRRGRLVAVQVGVKQRQFREVLVDPDLDALRREVNDGEDEGRVRREASKASRDRENPHFELDAWQRRFVSAECHVWRRHVLISRRDFVVGAAAGFVMTPRIGALAFDAFPILDPRPIFVLADAMYPGTGLSDEWRTRQFEYTWLRVAARHYADFWPVTEGTREMLDANIRNAGLQGIFEQVISTDLRSTYKPDPRAYQLGLDILKLKCESRPARH